MKKIVLFFIGAISLLVVMAVAFFGTMPIGINVPVYIDSVEILDTSMNSFTQKDSQGHKYFPLTFDWKSKEKDEQGNPYMVYIFNTEVLPTNCTSRRFSYSCPENAYVKEIQAASGVFLIKAMSYGIGESPYYVCDITCQAADGGPGNVEDSLRLVIKYGEGIVY